MDLALFEEFPNVCPGIGDGMSSIRAEASNSSHQKRLIVLGTAIRHAMSAQRMGVDMVSIDGKINDLS